MFHPELIDSCEIDLSLKLFKISVFEEFFYLFELLFPEFVDIFGDLFSLSDFDGDLSAEYVRHGSTYLFPIYETFFFVTHDETLCFIMKYFINL